ncbi:MAG: M23 family metallopeptidase [Bacteroidales bacterium]|nr:M23 family metallopeptidase [Bacteroidales bacterium]
MDIKNKNDNHTEQTSSAPETVATHKGAGQDKKDGLQKRIHRWFSTKMWNFKAWGRGMKTLYAHIKDVIKTKHRFVVMDSQTYKEKFAFQLSGVNFFVAIGVSVIVLIILTTVLIAFTPLREFIPGYANSEMVEQTYHNAAVIDSLEQKMLYQEWMINTIQDVLSERDMASEDDAQKRCDSIAALGVTPGEYTRSRSDSLLRLYVDQNDSRYQVRVPSQGSTSSRNVSLSGGQIGKGLFFTPVHGKIISGFDPQIYHYGVDVAAIANSPINAIYGGTVIFANFTVETGYVIAVQHPGNVISFYKHCSTLLKQQGDVVRVGEPLAYLGNSGELTTGPHLHFELWMNGKPVDPSQFIVF